MKRRTKRRVVRTAIMVVIVGMVAGVAAWSRWRHPDAAAAMRRQAEADQRIVSCQDNLQPQLRGRVESWLLTDTTPTSRGARLSFTANVDGHTAIYECEVTASGQVLAAGPVQ